jgi:hypothetical protein
MAEGGAAAGGEVRSCCWSFVARSGAGGSPLLDPRSSASRLARGLMGFGGPEVLGLLRGRSRAWWRAVLLVSSGWRGSVAGAVLQEARRRVGPGSGAELAKRALARPLRRVEHRLVRAVVHSASAWCG